MKKFVTVLMMSLMAVSVAAQAADKTVSQKVAEIEQQKDRVREIQQELAHAKSVRAAAFWVGIPVGVLTAIGGTYAGVSYGVNTGNTSIANKLIIGSWATTAVVETGSIVLVHMSNKEIEPLAAELALAQERLNKIQSAADDLN